jgi:tRNA threonylcarbamoyladenosine biosynthesis protein TsaE
MTEITGEALDFISHGAAQTQRLGVRLGELLEAGDVVLLEGHLGAGKTVLAQGIAQGLGIDDPVTSPTFTLIHEYEGRLPLYHVDLYRLAGDADAAAIGLEEYLYGNGVTVIEWPDRAATLVPTDRLAVSLRPVAETKRALRLVPHGEHYRRLVARFKREVFGL